MTNTKPAWRDVTNYSHPRASEDGHPLVFELSTAGVTIEVQHYEKPDVERSGWYVTCRGALTVESTRLVGAKRNDFKNAKYAALCVVQESAREIDDALGRAGGER